VKVAAIPAEARGYSASVISLAGLRKHLPLVVFIFLVLIAVMLVGFACACLTDHPMQAIEKALSTIPAAPAIIEVWSVLAAGVFAVAFASRPALLGRERASPAVLQRFLF
jgi:hypothetical protein